VIYHSLIQVFTGWRSLPVSPRLRACRGL